MGMPGCKGVDSLLDGIRSPWRLLVSARGPLSAVGSPDRRLLLARQVAAALSAPWVARWFQQNGALGGLGRSASRM